MLTQEKIESITNLVDSLTTDPVDQFVTNTANWGSINFELARKDLELIFSLCNHLKTLPISILPEAIADKIIDAITKAGQTIVKIKQFNIENSNPTSTRDALINEVKSYADNLLNVTKDWIPFLAYQKGDVQKNIDELSNAVDEAKKILASSVTETSNTKKEIDGIIVAAREASASAGVAVFTSDFDGQADNLEGQAATWLKYTTRLAIATVLMAFIFFFLPIEQSATPAQIFQYISSKLVLFIVLIGATIWCGRIYKALKHQVTVNKHRANALKTFQAFVKAGSDDSTRDAVLLETTSSIFSNSPSGYLDKADSSNDSSKRIYEIVKGTAEVTKNVN